MAKIVIIDGLARSGTTLMAALLNSQDGCATFKGIFHEPLACNLGSWPHDYARYRLVPSTEKVTVVQETNSIDNGLTLSWNRLKEQTLNAIERRQQTGSLSLEQWVDFLALNPTSLDQLDLLYQNLAQKLDAAVLGFRWNQGLSLVHNWLRNKEHYWIALVRNPLDRACSSIKTHQVSWEDSLLNSVKYYSMLTQVMHHPRVHVIYYEDLIVHAASLMSQLLEWLEIPVGIIQLEELVTQEGKPYRNESADQIQVHGTHKVGEAFDGIYTKAANRYLVEMPADVVEHYRHHLGAIPVLHRYFD